MDCMMLYILHICVYNSIYNVGYAYFYDSVLLNACFSQTESAQEKIAALLISGLFPSSIYFQEHFDKSCPKFIFLRSS